MHRTPVCPFPLAEKDWDEGEGNVSALGFPSSITMWLLALLQLAWLGWLLAFPVALDSDDALTFAHGVVRFSVLEFSPTFRATRLYLAGTTDQSAGRSCPRGCSGPASWVAVCWRHSAASRSDCGNGLLAGAGLAAGAALLLTPTLAPAFSDGPALAAWLRLLACNSAR